jgi:hypothetical protein
MIRSNEERAIGLFSYVRLEGRIVADPFAASDRFAGEGGSGKAFGSLCKVLSAHESPFDSARIVVQGDAAVGVFLAPLGAVFDGSDRTQPLVPLALWRSWGRTIKRC